IIPPPEPSETSRARLSGGWLRAARVGWVILGVAALGILLTSLPGYALKFSGQLGHVPSANPTTSVRFFAAAGGLASLASAALSLGLSWTLFRRKFEEPAAAALSYYLLVYGIVLAGPLESWWTRWVGNADFIITLQGALLATPTVALFALLPNGRFVPAWMRWALILSVPWNISLFFLPPFTTANITRQPLAYSLVAIWFTIFILLGIYAQIYHYRRVSTAEERQQTKWVVFGFALWIGFIFVSTGPYFYMTGLPSGAPLPWWASASQLGWWLSLSLVPVSLAIAVTRHRLWNIDLVINRTLVYGALTASVVALYVLVVGGLGLLFQSGNNLLIPLLATGLAAVLFQPLRERLQGSVNRLMYGERDDPYAVLSRLGARLEEALAPAAVLPAIAETVAHALKLPYAAIELRRGDAFELAASFGPLTSDVVTYPISYQTETVGRLLCAPRSPRETFSAADEQLLRTIAGQAGAAVHAVQLTDALQRSRERLVTAREEERRRIRRDLHDGLGPALAVQALKQETALETLDDDPDAARQLLRELYEHTHSLLTDVRRLVYDLRPPALDELGLVSAVREQAVQLVHGSTGFRVAVETPTDLPELPAAIETAAYRIAVEAIANVARHARAHRCVVRIELAGDGHALCVEVEDDGRGLAEDTRVGVGLTSMRERAAELGGTCEVRTAAGGGTQVRARLPLPREA
ncbi:MAG: sensor histidine kinase, partial [Anaerolineales bacterium]